MAAYYTPTANTVAYWKLDDVNDSSGNGKTLTNNNGVAFVAGKLGNCADFGDANSNKSLQIADTLGITTGAITISFLLNIANQPDVADVWHLIWHANTTSKVAHRIMYRNISGVTSLGFERTRLNVANDVYWYPITLTPGTWYYITHVYTGSYVRCYVNGVYINQVASSGAGNSGAGYFNGVYLSNYQNDVSQFLNGKLDEVIIENIAWSDAQVLTYYNAQTITAKTRIKQANLIKTSTAKIRIKIIGITKTVTSKTRIKRIGVSKTSTSKIDVKKYAVARTETAKTRIKQANNTETITAKMYLVYLRTKTETSKIRVKRTEPKTITAKIRTKIINLTNTLSARVRVYTRHKFTKYSHFIGSHDNGSIYTNSATFTPTTNETSNPWLLNTEHFNNTKFKFEADVSLHTGVTQAEIRLYDLTDGAVVSSSTITVNSSGSVISGELSLTNLHEYIAQARVTGGSGYIRACRPRLYILQDDDKLTKTETYFPVACAYTGFSTINYKTLYPGESPAQTITTPAIPGKTLTAKMFVSPASGKYVSSKVHIKKLGESKTATSAINIYQGSGGVFVFNSSDWNGAVEFYLEAHFGSTEARTNYIQLYNITSNESVAGSEISNSGTASRQRSESFTLEDGEYYSIQTKSSSLGERINCGEVRLIAYQNATAEPEKNITKTLTFYDLRLSTEEITVSDTTYASLSKLDAGLTTDHGFNFNYLLDYNLYSFYPKLFVTGRSVSNVSGAYKFKVYDSQESAYITSELATTFPYQSKSYAIDATDGHIANEIHKFLLYGHKGVGDPNAVISLYGVYLGVQLKTRVLTSNAKLRVAINRNDFETVASATIRKITGRLYIKWNGVDWVDESEYLISSKGNSQYSGRKGEIIADQCDFELDNVSKRFLRDNENSNISNYIKPNVEIKFEIGINGYYTRVFTGKIQTIDPDMQSGIVNLSCTDNTWKLIDVLAPTTLYTNKRFNEVIEILALNCGIETQNYLLEESYNIAETVWFENKTTNDILTSLVEAERGRIFFDTSGNLVFWNNRHFENQQTLVSLSKNDWILNFHSKVDENDIVNKITISSKPRKPQGIQVVWSNGNAIASDQYNDMLVWIPAESYQNALIELDDPAIDWQIPLAIYDYTANSEADGSGTDLTSNIEITEFTTYEKQAFLTVTNNGLIDAYLTEFNVRANPLTVYKYIRTIYTDDASITKYGTKDVAIENNWISSDEMANEIKEAEINANKDAINSYELEMIGRPDITAGELISVETKENSFTSFQIRQNDWTIDFNGYVQKLELIEKETSTTNYEESYGIGSGILGGGIIGRSARNRMRIKTATSKIAVKKAISTLATAKVNISI